MTRAISYTKIDRTDLIIIKTSRRRSENVKSNSVTLTYVYMGLVLYKKLNFIKLCE